VQAIDFATLGELADYIESFIRKHEIGCDTKEVAAHLGVSVQFLGDSFEVLKSEGKLMSFAGYWVTEEGFETLTARFLKALEAAHKADDRALAFDPVEIARAANWMVEEKQVHRAVTEWAQRGVIAKLEAGVRLPTEEVYLSPKQERLLDRVVMAMLDGRLHPPAPMDIAKTVGAPKEAVMEMIRLGSLRGVIVVLADGVYYTPQQLEMNREVLREKIGTGFFAPGDARDALKTSRKFSDALLDYFDEQGWTERNGVRRKLV